MYTAWDGERSSCQNRSASALFCVNFNTTWAACQQYDEINAFFSSSLPYSQLPDNLCLQMTVICEVYVLMHSLGQRFLEMKVRKVNCDSP